MSISAVVTVELLEALLSPAAARRKPAEEHLQGMTGPARCQSLLQALGRISQPHLQQMVAVLLRRDILQLQDCSILPAVTVELLAAFSSTNCRQAVGECLAEVCAVLSVLQPETCGPVLQQILQAIGSSASQGDIPSLRLLVNLADRAPRAFCASSALDSLPQLLQAALASSRTGPITTVLTDLVVTAAVATTFSNKQAIGSAASVDATSAATQLGRSCLPQLLPAWSQIAAQTDSLHATAEHLTRAAVRVPSLLAGDTAVLQAVVETCLLLASQLSNEGRDSALCCLSVMQVVSSICAVGDVKRKIVQPALRQAILQGHSNVKGVLSLCLESVVSGTDGDCQGWATEPATLNDDGVGWEGDEIALYAEQLLESLLQTFGSHALAVVLPLVEHLLGSSAGGDFKLPRAGLVAMQYCLSATPISFAPHLAVAMEAALSLSSSSNVRVQFQAILLLGVLCETGQETVLEQYGARLWQTLACAAQSPCTKIAAMACLAMVSYCRGDPSSKTEIDGERFVVPFLSDVLQALVAGPLSLELVDSGSVVVKVRAVGAVACLAQASGPEFVSFYSSIMPGLLACAHLSAGGNYEVSRLKGAAVEAATIVGQSIGEDHREMFVDDAEQIMRWVLPILSQSPENDTSGMPLDQLFSACARIASVMGEAYAPFLDAVLPRLLSRATGEADVSISEGNETGLEATKREELEMDEDAGTESMTVAVPGRGLTKVTINTTKIQEKAQAARAIYEHASALGAAFGPFCKSCLDAFLLLLQFKYSSEIRATAAQTLAAIFEASCCHGARAGMQVPAGYLPIIAKSIAKQIQSEESSDSEVVFALADSLSEIYYSVYSRLVDHGRTLLCNFSVGDVSTVVQLCMESMVSCLGRRDTFTRVISGAEGALTGDDEREEYEGLLRGEEALLTPLVDSVGYSLKFLKGDFVSIFESEVAPVLGPYLRSGNDMRARLSAVCLFDDCVEHCGAAAAERFAPMLVGGVMAGLDDATNGGDDELKRASIYGVAQMARYSPPAVLDPHVQIVLGHLLSITRVQKVESENLMLYENAISALASLLLIGAAPFKSTGFIKRDTALNMILTNLPLREDEDEAKICHAGLCELVENASIDVESQCSELVRIIGETMAYVSDGEDLALPGTCTAFAAILFRMQQKVRPDLMQQSYASISPDAQEAIQSLMNEHAHQFANIVTP